jgi:hypothetical protein
MSRFFYSSTAAKLSTKLSTKCLEMWITWGTIVEKEFGRVNETTNMSFLSVDNC